VRRIAVTASAVVAAVTEWTHSGQYHTNQYDRITSVDARKPRSHRPLRTKAIQTVSGLIRIPVRRSFPESVTIATDSGNLLARHTRQYGQNGHRPTAGRVSVHTLTGVLTTQVLGAPLTG
jgi:hypothetical protein